MARCCVIKDSTGDVIVRCDVADNSQEAKQAVQAAANAALALLPHSPPATTRVVQIARVGDAVN